MKEIFRNVIHTDGKSHEVILKEIAGKKVKFTYEAYNGVECLSTEIFDGNKFNEVFSMIDLGFLPDTSAYSIYDEIQRKNRAENLFFTAEAMVRKLLS